MNCCPVGEKATNRHLSLLGHPRPGNPRTVPRVPVDITKCTSLTGMSVETYPGYSTFQWTTGISTNSRNWGSFRCIKLHPGYTFLAYLHHLIVSTALRTILLLSCSPFLPPTSSTYGYSTGEQTQLFQTCDIMLDLRNNNTFIFFPLMANRRLTGCIL